MICLRHLGLLVTVFMLMQTLPAQNDKQVLGDAVLTPAEIAEGATITYLIRFQNIGIDTAYQVIVRDTFDPRLDLPSFDMVASSHAYQLVRDGSNIVRWYFDDISLPDSSNGGSNSIGFILFTVRPKSYLTPGQTIVNRACATFDQVNTICTNDAIVWIDAGADVDEPGDEPGLRIIPNPNYGNFEVRTTAVSHDPDAPAAEWWISDLNGKVIWDGRAENMAAAGTQVLLERPAPGLYLLWIKDHGRLQVKEFAVIR